MNPEDLFIQRRLNGITRQLSGIVKNFEEFREEYPHVIAPNILEAMIGNLKDDINILLREVNMIGSPNREKLQQRRWICRSCNAVFMAPLVAGVCDECRARGITTQDLPPAPSTDDEKIIDRVKSPSAPEATDSSADPLPEAGEPDSADPFTR
ncbi:hypothetical protein JXA47_16235 [Candidatus Sumerlaeota bacterium]|nr:hypothetical protein [Candidatus Sumerlaeota bacterium]